MEPIKTIHATELNQLAKKGCIILDVRTDMEHREAHLDCPHIHLPLDELNGETLSQVEQIQKDTPIYILCRSGKRATAASQRLKDDGYENTCVIEGGILACQECGTPTSGTTVVKTGSACGATIKSPISLERQVRIAAGICVAIGSVLALTLSPLWAIMPLAVGCGLVFAGVTDRCGLALILTKAPWNQK